MGWRTPRSRIESRSWAYSWGGSGGRTGASVNRMVAAPGSGGHLQDTTPECQVQGVRSRQCQGFPRNPGRFHPGSGLSPSLDQLGAIERGAITPVPRISTKSGPFSPGEWLESLPGSARGYCKRGVLLGEVPEDADAV